VVAPLVDIDLFDFITEQLNALDLTRRGDGSIEDGDGAG
jgi:hypothetical protein